MANDPKKFKFPNSITIFGHKYLVKFVPDLYHTKNAYGYLDEDTKTIEIQTPGKLTKEVEDVPGKKCKVEFEVTATTVVETFYHELMHAVLYSIERDKLSADESLVGMLGKAMLQVFLYSDYDESKKVKTTKKSSSSGK